NRNRGGVQLELQWRIRRCQKDYMKKMLERIAQNNMRNVWRGLKNFSGCGQGVRGTADGDHHWQMN
ncbi:hypothetical protein XENOCAPTIV_015692, partial [Xenoophorus captivus]